MHVQTPPSLAMRLEGSSGGVDTSRDTVTPGVLLRGYTAHNAAGEQIVGTYDEPAEITPAPANAVNFRDYDGTCYASYTLAEAQSLTALPEGPTHKGLIFDGWNWSLDEVRALTRPMEIGACYVTDDGKTRLYLSIPDERLCTVGIYSRVGAAGQSVDVDWGDGTTETVTPTNMNLTVWHTYAGVGEYVIRLTPAAGTAFTIAGRQLNVLGAGPNNTAQASVLQKVEIGAQVEIIGQHAFDYCGALETVTVPAAVATIGNHAFMGGRLRALTIPRGVTSVSSGAVYDCTGLRYLMMPADGVTNLGTAVSSNSAINSLTLPDSVTAFTFLSKCPALPELYIPAGVTSIPASAFAYNYGVQAYHFLATEPPTLANTNAFDGILSTCVIYVPPGSLSAYQSATNWAAYAGNMQEEPA